MIPTILLETLGTPYDPYDAYDSWRPILGLFGASSWEPPGGRQGASYELPQPSLESLFPVILYTKKTLVLAQAAFQHAR